MRAVRIHEVQDFLKKEETNGLLINVLSTSEFEEEHIPGSINVPLESDFIQKVQNKALDKDVPIIVYCAGFECPASRDAATLLEKDGFSNVMEFEGGMEEWKEAGKKVTSGS